MAFVRGDFDTINTAGHRFVCPLPLEQSPHLDHHNILPCHILTPHLQKLCCAKVIQLWKMDGKTERGEKRGREATEGIGEQKEEDRGHQKA